MSSSRIIEEFSSAENRRINENIEVFQLRGYHRISSTYAERVFSARGSREH